MISHLQRWLLAFSDPAGPRPLPGRPLRRGQLDGLFHLADAHGVLPAMRNNVRCAAERFGAGRVAKGGPQALGTCLEAAETLIRKQTALGMLLRRQGQEILAALAEQRLPAIVFKGPVFADRLYQPPALRTFVDLDILVPEDALGPVGNVMAELGYRPDTGPMKYVADYGQQRWLRTGPGGPIEIHWDLVNSPRVRQRVSVTFEDIQFEPGPHSQPPGRLSPASLVLMAAVHAATSHGFDRLGPLYDLCQAVRGEAGAIHEAWLAEAVSRTGSGLALAAALDLCERIIGEPACARLRRRLDLPVSRLVRCLISRRVVLRRHAWIDSFRRQAFREMLKRR